MSSSRLRGGPSGLRGTALLLGLGLAAACASRADVGISWDARTAEAELERAQEAAAQGQREQALELGRRALRHAREAAAVGTIGRALLLVGSQEPDLASCLDAIVVFQGLGDRPGEADARLAAAGILLDLGRGTEALEQLGLAEGLLDPAGSERTPWARSSARLHHDFARALRSLGRADEAQSRERQADLALSLLDDADMLRLRIDVQLGLAESEAAHGWPDRAIEHNSRALYLAQRTGDRSAQLAALTGVVSALTDLRRYEDALAHCERALVLAQDIGDPRPVQELGRRGLALLVQLGDDSGSARRQAFEAALLAGT